MKIGERWRTAPRRDDVPSGPWSDLPPTPAPPRAPVLRPRRAKGAREPIIGNWRGLVIVLFLLLIAPWLARWASAVILGLMPGH